MAEWLARCSHTDEELCLSHHSGGKVVLYLQQMVSHTISIKTLEVVPYIVEEQSVGPVTLSWKQRFDG